MDEKLIIYIMEPKDSEYYLGNRDCLPATLTVKTDHTVITQELPWDVSAEDLINAFYTACVGITFNPDSILRAMKDFAEEHLPNEEEEYYENQE